MRVELIDALTTFLSAFNVSVRRLEPPFAGLETFDYGLRREIDPMFDWQEFGEQLLRAQEEAVLTLAEDTFGARYATFCPPGEEGRAVILIGPWRGAQRTGEQLAWAQRHLPERCAAAADCCYDVLPQLSERPVLGSIIALVGMQFPPERFRVVKMVEYRPLMFAPDARYFTEPDLLQDLPAALLEQRCDAENAFLDVVSQGDSAEALRRFQQYCRFDPGGRFCGTLRSRKNELIALNTLLRKAIERGGVHPCYLDVVSTKYAYKIETVGGEGECEQMQSDMLREYCAYVRRYSLRQYSATVQKTMNYINMNLSRRLSLRSLAAQCFISPSYLSNLFKQETGSTLTDYINVQRVQRAAHRLVTTSDTVAVIAAGVGILDVNYFTKIFKKVTGFTPTAYRREHR